MDKEMTARKRVKENSTERRPEVWGATHRGSQSQQRQDAVFFSGPKALAQAGIAPRLVKERGRLLAIADGRSVTRNTGQILVENLVQAYYRQQESNLGEALREAIHEANQQTARTLATSGSSSTLVAGVLRERQFYLANIGNNRAYLLRDGQLNLLTRDHVDADGHLARSLVNDPLAAPDLYRPLHLQAGDRLLLCSDGLYRSLQATRLAESATNRDVRQAVEQLLSQAGKADSAGDISAIVVHVPGQKRSLLPGFSSVEIAGLALLVVLALAQIVLLIQQWSG